MAVQQSGQVNSPAQAIGDSTAIRRLQREMLRLTTAATNYNDLLGGLLQLIAQHAKFSTACYFGRNERNELTQQLNIAGEKNQAANKRPDRLLLSMATAACRNGAIESRRQAAPDRLLLAAPVVFSNRDPESICLIFTADQPESVLVLLLEMAVAHLVLWHVLAESRGHAVNASDAAAAVELVDMIISAKTLHEAAYLTTGTLENHLQCGRIALGLKKNGNSRARLVSVSGVANFDSSSVSATAIESAMDEAALRNELTKWPPENDEHRHASLAHKNLSMLEDGATIVTLPLCDQQDRTVAVVMLIAKAGAEIAAAERFLTAAEKSLAASIVAVQSLEGGILAKTVRQSLKFIASWKGIAAAVGVLLLGAAMFIPTPHRIVCDCQIEPVTRRFVAAPFESALEKSLVKPGDVVKKGDLLARLDGREIRWKQAGLIADRSQAEKKRDKAQVERNYSEQQIAQLEIERLDLEIQLLDHRSKNLEIRSPLDGIVVSGDLDRAEGAPVTIGQSLFEIAPLETMVVETATPDDDVAYVARKQPVSVELNAYPNETWQTHVSLISPRSEIRDDQNIFIAESTLPNPNGLLRPGMKGRATISAPWQPLGWVLFHKPWEFLKRQLTF